MLSCVTITERTTEMTEDNQKIKEIFQLLWAGDKSAVKRLIAVEIESLEPQVAEIKATLAKKESDLATLYSLAASTGDQISPEKAGVGTTQGAEGRKLSQAQKRHRKREILKAADEVSANGKEFSSEDIMEILQKSGIAMGIPENRMNTAIGAVLRRQEDYERLDKGVYRKRMTDLPQQGGNGEAIRK